MNRKQPGVVLEHLSLGFIYGRTVSIRLVVASVAYRIFAL